MVSSSLAGTREFKCIAGSGDSCGMAAKVAPMVLQMLPADRVVQFVEKVSVPAVKQEMVEAKAQ